MKTKFRFYFNGIATVAVIMLTLLSSIALAWPAADVESRANPSWDAEHGNRGADRAALETLKRMEFLQQEVQELRGKVEEQSYQLQQLQEHQKKLYLDLDRRLREGSPTQASGASPTVSLDDIATSSAASVQTSRSIEATSDISNVSMQQNPPAEEQAYQRAYRLIQNKDYDGALAGFKQLISSFPNGKYVPNANYWLGEIYLVKGELDLAFAAFDRVYRDHPQHPKAADSLLKLGYVEYTKGQWNRANALLMQVKSQYPGSTSAQLADSRMQRMRQEGHL